VKLEQGAKKYEKMTPKIKEFVQKQVDENCTITLKNVKKLIFLKFQATVCESTIHSFLKKIHYSLKMLKLIPERRNDPKPLKFESNMQLTLKI